jgi:hypothetical protein
MSCLLEAKVNLEGKTPSNGRREDPAALPPLLGRGIKPRPATKGATPPWNPLERFPVASHGAYEPLVKLGIIFRIDFPLDMCKAYLLE